MGRKLGTPEESSALDDCQHVDSVSFDMESDFRKGKNECGRWLRQSRSGQDLKCPTRGMYYELTAEEPSKLHLTTRMVTSSPKASPQKSAALL